MKVLEKSIHEILILAAFLLVVYVLVFSFFSFFKILISFFIGSLIVLLLLRFIGGKIPFILFLVLFFLIFPQWAFLIHIVFIIPILLFMISGIYFNGFYVEWFPKIHTPRQRIYAGIKRSILSGLILSLLISLLFAFLFQLNISVSDNIIGVNLNKDALFFGDFGTGNIALEGSLLSVIVMLFLAGVVFSLLASDLCFFGCLYLTLTLLGKIPFRFSNFLQIVSKNSGLIYPDGGTWRFRHKLIFDWFANSFEE